MTAVSRAYQRLGHENLGFLSESHGLMPIKAPQLRLPPGYEVWDEMAESLPELHRTLAVRRALEAMPLLSAAESDLPDEYLLRASVIIGMLAHSYYRVEANPPHKPMPEGIQRPWEEIARRLDRPAPHLSFIDLIMYNWRLIHPDRADPMRVDNLRLLVPAVDNREERIFYLTQVEMLAQSTPVISALVRAQEAVFQDDAEVLKRELLLITETLHLVTHQSFMSTNPNAYSDSYVDPVVWAKTVAPFAVPIQSGVVGSSGSAAPIFHVLDVFFSRQKYDTPVGQEMTHHRNWYPKHWRDFLAALAEISVSEYVEKRQDPNLKGMFKEATQAYLGNGGFLSRHRLKAYGYLDIAFKVGRSVTIAGFAGQFKDRTWDQIDHELAAAQEEREASFPQSAHHAGIKRVETINPAGDPARWVKRIVLDVSRTGIRYRPGDRCAVLPENSDDLIDRTLVALKARGDETIPLTSEWREAIHLRDGYQGATQLPLRMLLRFGCIRPVARPVARVLYAASLNSTLRHIIEARAEDQWELWDLLEMLNGAGFDPRGLWRALPGEREHICRVVPPESFRMYSISSRMGPGSADGASELHLTIGRLVYDTSDTQVSTDARRLGTASHFLGDRAAKPMEEMDKVALRLVHPSRFSLPDDPSIPIVMFAGGTGISPFQGFIRERAEQENAGENWLFFGARTPAEFYYREELQQMVAQGRLHVRLAFSREAVDVKFVSDGSAVHFVYVPGEKRHIRDEMLREENIRVLWDLLRSKKDGGRGAYFYVCGRPDFANSVKEAVKEILRRYSHGSEEEKEARARQTLYRLVGEQRYKQEIFTTYTGPLMNKRLTYDASDIVLHNGDELGYWMVIDGRVYDLTEFAHLHPGGFKVLRGYAGTDATPAYQKVLHHASPEIDAMLGMYEVGAVRRLDFGVEWGVVVGPQGLHYMPLAEVYTAWVRFLYTIVEMENALHNDFTLKHYALTRDESPASHSPFKLQFMLEVHDRFILNYIDGAMGQPLEDLWAITSGVCAQNEDVRWMHNTIESIRQRQEADTIIRFSNDLAARIQDIAQSGASEEDRKVAFVKECCALMEAEDKRFLQEVKMAVRAGIRVFEMHERDAIKRGSHQLLEAIRQIPRILEAYHGRILSGALHTLLTYTDR